MEIYSSIVALGLLFISCANQEKIIIRNSFTETKEDKSITIPELRKHVFYLASDSMNGRETGSKEYLLAANYCAEQLRKTGIQPLLKDSANNLTYFQNIQYSYISVTSDCEFHENARYISPNIVGFVKGTDANLSNQYVVVGAHLDHIGPGYNGADDNASGCAGLLEIAEAIATNPPERSVLFILFSGEEKGLLGSGYFVENSPVSTDSIIAMINLDMIGRSVEKYEKERTHFIAGIGNNGERMLEFVEEVNRQTCKWPLKRLTSKEGNCYGSDHAKFAEKGIPSVFFFSGQHKDLHCVTDKPDKIDFDKMQASAQLAYEVTRQMANR